MNGTAIKAVFLRDLRGYFGSPLGYLFVVAFVLVTGVAAFFPEDFFPANKANLDLLSGWFPFILAVLLVPAVTMGSWADEKRQGTQDLLFTLPIQDHELVLAKYLSCLAVYTVALLFTTSHIAVLAYLGSPDPGLMFTTYLGYWLMGAAMIAVGMLASALTDNLTVAFILSLLFNLLLAGLQYANGLVGDGSPLQNLPGPLQRLLAAAPGDLLAALSPARRAESLTHGVIALEDLLYFPALAWTALFATTLVVGRRHWTRGAGRGLHGGLRLASILIGAMSLVLVAQRGAARADVTGLLSLTSESRAVLAKLDPERPVYVQAWISPEVPGDWIPVRDALVRTLEEMDARAGDRLQVVIHQPELFSPEAEQAEKSFGIKPRKVTVEDNKRFSEVQMFMGLAFTCGAREEVIPFFDKGLPVQYELTRAIGVVADQERAKVGILSGDARWFGGFDFQSRSQSRDWMIVQDLRRQYEVSEVQAAGTAAIDTSLQVLVVVQPSNLKQEALDRVAEYLFQGGRALFLSDPYPMFNLGLAPGLADAGRNPFQPPPPDEKKGDVDALMHALGLSWDKERVVWDMHNPHPKYQQFPHEIVFLSGDSEQETGSFDEQDPVTKGLQEVVLIFAGSLEARQTEGVTTTPLLTTRSECGYNPIKELVEDVPFMGPQQKPPSPRMYTERRDRQVLAMRSQGLLTGTATVGEMQAGARATKPFQAIVIADADLVGDGLYQLRREGREEFDLDNVTFVSNCIDSLAGEEDYIQLRKQRPRHRTLTRLEGIKSGLDAKVREVAKTARESAEKQLQEAQKRLDEAVEAIKGRSDLDYRTKSVQLAYVEQREQRKLDAEKERIEAEEQAAVHEAETDAERALRAEKARIRLAAATLPPIPALILGLIVFLAKRSLEAAGTSPARRRSA